MWTHIVHTVTHWPWSTIAAFAAALAAVVVARSEIRERRQLMGRETVINVNANSLIWHTEAGKFLGCLRQHFQGQMSANDVNGEPLARVTAAIADMDRVLMSARMTCNDFKMLLRVAEAQSKLGAFAERLQRSPEESFDQQRERLDQILQSGLTDIQGFGEAIDAFVTRGFAVYSPRRGWRFRLLERRFKRQVEAENKRRQCER